MTNAEKKLILQTRLHKVLSRGRQLDCPGVVRKLERQLRNLEK